MIFVGDDWSEEHHDIEIRDQAGMRLGRKRLPEGIAGIAELHAMVAGHASDPAEVVVGIETDRGLWVAALVAAGYQVYAINPKAVARYRERYGGGSGAKSDAADAKVLADRVKGSWEERFERSYGFWRGFVDEVVLAFQACGDFEGGFARVYCDECRSDYLVAFSCSRRVFCPSCAAKRAAIFGALLREEILEEVGHAQWVFTIPKLLRPYFLHHRELLGKLSQAAWETVHELIAAANADDRAIRPGIVSVVQTATDLLEWSPHVHALVSRGGWDRAGIWVPVPYVDATSAELLFRHKVIALLRDEELLTEQRIELLLSWQNTGFSVHNSVTVGPEDAAGSERLARYLLRPPLSLERMSLDAEGSVLYRRKAPGRFGGAQATFDAMDFLARLLMHIPQPKLHTVRYYGEYSSVARARRRAEHVEAQKEAGAAATVLPCAAERRRLRRAWAQMIRRVYEVDPLTCRCGAQMRVVAFILDPQVVTKILRHIASSDTARERAPPASALAS